MQVRSLGWEDPLEKGTATHSSIFAWRMPWKEEPGGLQSMGSQRVRRDWSNLEHTHKSLEHFLAFSKIPINILPINEYILQQVIGMAQKLHSGFFHKTLWKNSYDLFDLVIIEQ